MLGYRLAALLLERNLSHEQAAAITGLSRATITLICEGQNENPKLSTILALSKGLRVPIGYFVGESELEDAEWSRVFEKCKQAGIGPGLIGEIAGFLQNKKPPTD